MSISDLTSPTAMKLAIEECNRLGRQQFLTRYGFASAKEYRLYDHGREFDSKAIVGVAHRYQFPETGPLKSAEFSGGIASSGAATRAFDLGFDIEGLKRGERDWTLEQCEEAVSAYFECLGKKMAAQPFNRTQACRTVAAKITRSRGSVDYKFQNIDAILYESDLPRMMDGIAANVQRLLRFVVLDPLAKHNEVFETVPHHVPEIENPEQVLVDPPRVSTPKEHDEEQKARAARRVDFAKREAGNRKLGKAGEKWVLDLEKKRLLEAGKKDLADQVDWIAERLGDGLGYDIASFDQNGGEIFLEVKTSNAGISTPFFISSNEIAAAARLGDAYWLYRVFDFSTKARAYVLTGPLQSKLCLKPQTYSALPGSNKH